MLDIDKKILLQALDNCDQAMVIVGAEQRELPVVYVNTAFEALTGLDAASVVGTELRMLLVEGQVPEWSPQWLREDDEDCEQRWRDKSGGVVSLKVRRTPLFECPGRPSAWLLTVLGPADAAAPAGEAALRDALHDARRKLKRLERTDAATGVPNERVFGEILQRDWGIARREHRRVCLVVFAVDYLDEYRRSLGRHATDSVLRKIAHAINGSLRRASDFGARVGDDRFATLLGSADEAQAGQFAARVVRKVSSLAIPHPRSPHARNITVSYGVASMIPEWKAGCDVLLEQADRELERARAERAAAAAAAAAAEADAKAEQGTGTRTDLKRLSR